MTVNLIISGQSMSTPLPDSVDFGSVAPGASSSYQDLYIRHDAVFNEITDCGFYLNSYVGQNYLGNDPNVDYDEIIGWGETEGEGFLISQEPTFITYTSLKTGVGTVTNPLILDAGSIIDGTPSGDGEIPVSAQSHVRVKFVIPTVVSNPSGYRSITLVLAYSATS
jgi:hypothetical protein